MSSSLLARRVKVPVSSPLRLQSTPTRSKSSVRPEGVGDPKKDLIRRTLYPSNLRNKATPTGTWRPDVGRALQHAIPSSQAHQTIDRAWQLHQRHIRKKREADLAVKFARMKEAMDELEKLDRYLYLEANKQEDPRVRTKAEMELTKTLKGHEKKAIEGRIRGLFPRELKLPTDTPPRNGWNYEWTPTIKPASS
ncbi:hypothetical protein JAAARDRAFT_29024 [Jaapia argillacea MUCL 33604]|uniref:Large ribosomal subunit protein mL40 n=1 Tax=Jaapia argillacea MUCL 33604 TaxID=933084 RepID=A0A067Q7L2_9AGAM|nr:hypothetical protein JAAARDRAFT_29024 [Jaapia argillacea MUCL 33604]